MDRKGLSAIIGLLVILVFACCGVWLFARNSDTVVPGTEYAAIVNESASDGELPGSPIVITQSVETELEDVFVESSEPGLGSENSESDISGAEKISETVSTIESGENQLAQMVTPSPAHGREEPSNETTALAGQTTESGSSQEQAMISPEMEAQTVEKQPIGGQAGENSEPLNQELEKAQDEVAAHNHTFEKIYWYGEPTCVTANNYYNLICSVCGEIGGTGTDTVPHVPNMVETESREGCTRYRILEGTCLVCGIMLDRQAIALGAEHNMITAQTGPIWNETLQDFETQMVTYCSRCGLTANTNSFTKE